MKEPLQVDPAVWQRLRQLPKAQRIECLLSLCELEEAFGNHTVRMHVRRLTRLTNAFSKKWEDFRAAMALHFCYYNFCKCHSAIKMTPAMAAGVEDSYWTMADLVEMRGEPV